MNPLQLALSVRSDFSLGESSFQLSQIIERAKEQGLTHIGLVDMMTVSAMPAISEKAAKAGLDIITGCTLQVVDDPRASLKFRDNNGFRLKVYVMSDRGLQSLFAALSKALSPEYFYYHARLGLDDVLALEDVMVTSGDVYSLWHHPRAAEISQRLHATFGDRYYAELVAVDTPLYDRVNKLAWATAAAEGIPAIVSRPAFYATPDDAGSRDVLRAISTNDQVDSPWVPRPYTRDLCLMAPKQFVTEATAAAARAGCPTPASLLKNAVALAERAAYRFKKLAPTMPKMAENEFATLVKAVQQGWGQRFSKLVWGHQPDPADLAVYKERLQFELGVLKKMGFSGYFLLVQDIVNWSKENGVRVGPGRGSVGGSLVAYLMGITDVDPIRFGLLFERFINPDRLDLPDADLDFMAGKRHMVLDYVTNKYGRDHVAAIVNFSTLGAASALRDTARLHGLPAYEYACSKQMEKEHGVSLSLTESADKVPDIDKFRNERPIVWNHALRLEGCNRTLSQHAAGLIVAGEPVRNRAVVSTRGDKDGTGLPVAQWDKTQVENFGLIKIDVLGLTTLDVIDVALTYVKERHGRDIDPLSLDLTDQTVLEAFSAGDTAGVFQFEGSGMRQLLKNMALGGRLTFEDITAATALFRPGPLDAGLTERFTQVKKGLTTPRYDHPILENCLKETYGVLTYQEQIMQMCRELAGFTPGEADGVRKAMGKKDHDKMAEYEGRFVAGAVAAGLEKYKAEELWTTTAGFAGYAFNKSHSVEYTLISWITMYLKVYFPAEFFAAAMTVQDKDEKLATIVADAQAKKIKVLPPDINISTARIEIDHHQDLYAPFQAIKGISSNVAESILALRKANGGSFQLTADGKIDGLAPAFQKQVLGRTKVTTAHVEKLAKVGAFWSVDKVGHPGHHPDRLRDRLEFMPGFTVDMVKPERVLATSTLHKIQVVRLTEETRSCTKCSLAGKPHPMPRLGDTPRFMLVFDSPNWQEEKAGKMLEGENAEIIKAALRDVGLKASEGYFTSLVKVVKPKGQKVLTNEQINGCSAYLKQEIEILKPPIIIAMGSNAVRYFSPGVKGTPSDLAGKVIFNQELDASIIYGINPAVLFHDPGKAKLIEAVFDKLSTLLS